MCWQYLAANNVKKKKEEDTGNPDGYVQFGRLFLAGEW